MEKGGINETNFNTNIITKTTYLNYEYFPLMNQQDLKV